LAKWIVLNKGGNFQEIGQHLRISPILARIVRNRGAVGEEAARAYLYGTMQELHDPYLLHGMDDAVELLGDKIAEKRKIRVIGDYDVDGVCSSYILWRLITYLGGDASVRLPDRVKDGYGLNETMVEEAVRDGVDTIITCDNGIAAAGALEKAKEAGLAVIVTDHHEIPFHEEDGVQYYDLPGADVILEPKMAKERIRREDAGPEAFYYPFRDICGAEVTYKLAAAMLGNPDLTDPAQSGQEAALLRELLAFAAIATVCDVMPLQDENRILVREGLKEASRTENVGLKALLLATGIYGTPLTGYHAGFVIGPCINACGRMENAQKALDLFMESNPVKASVRAEELRNLNEERKSLTEQGVQEACAQVEAQKAAGGSVDKVFLLYLPDTRESIAGIIAGKVREKYAHPTFVLTDAEGQPGMLKGSGRSIDAYDMFSQMNGAKDLMEKFGGHKLAAGLSVKKENLQALRARLNDQCSLGEDAFRNVIYVDMVMSPGYASAELVQQMKLLEPCGQGNAKPLFIAAGLTVQRGRILGKKRNVVRFEAQDGHGSGYPFLLFSAGEGSEALLEPGTRIDAVYYPDLNEYNGTTSLQFVIRDWQFSKR
ncbi:MAG: single-stranded-DNA-specific exonuclease RecJ, partial [Lachnospiraceae bacterium]